MSGYLLSIDQGTTSTRAIIFNTEGRPVATAQKEIQLSYPKEGWVEQDPEMIWQDVLMLARQVIAKATISADQVLGIGITNQRETTLIWDKVSSKPIMPAIVWQDRRTALLCEDLQQQGLEPMITAKTGLLLDPYFSATKIRWILDNMPVARKQAESGELVFGTIDSFILWRLTGGQVHATDATNASRTLLFNIHTQSWDNELLKCFNIPHALLPEVKDCCADFGVTLKEHFGVSIPIVAIAGDQQAAAIGQVCFQEGMLKSTYGTGCFMLMNTGKKVIQSQNRLISTVAYRIKDKTTYAVEGSIFIAGAALQWLRDAIKLIRSAQEAQDIAMKLEDTQGVYLVPAFTGLGAPYWDPLARGAILGLTRDSGVEHIVRAALESVCYQTKDLLTAMEKETTKMPQVIRVDGGMAANDWLMQFLADILDITIERPNITETTALGVCFLAGLQLGLYSSLEQISALWQRERLFEARMPADRRDSLYQGWLKAVERIRG